MSRYKSTTKRRYMWGIGVICSLLLIAISSLWALQGKFAYRWRAFGNESSGEIQKEKQPLRFWIVVGSFAIAGVASSIITSMGLSKVQNEEAGKIA